MKMQGLVFSGSVKSTGFCKRGENSKTHCVSNASLHFQEGVQRKTECNEVILNILTSEVGWRGMVAFG